MIFQTSIRCTTGHSSPSCSVFARGTYGSAYNSSEWTPSTFLFVADSGLSWHEVGFPWCRYDFLYLRWKIASGDSFNISTTTKFIGDMDLPCITTVAFNVDSITGKDTMKPAFNLFLTCPTSNTDTVWLPAAALATKPIYVATLPNGGGLIPTSTTICPTGSDKILVTGNHSHLVADGTGSLSSPTTSTPFILP